MWRQESPWGSLTIMAAYLTKAGQRDWVSETKTGEGNDSMAKALAARYEDQN